MFLMIFYEVVLLVCKLKWIRLILILFQRVHKNKPFRSWKLGSHVYPFWNDLLHESWIFLPWRISISLIIMHDLTFNQQNVDMQLKSICCETFQMAIGSNVGICPWNWT